MSCALSLVIVSEDWFARAVLKSAAEAAGFTGRIVLADDGYTALAETWEAVDAGRPPDVFLIDQNAMDASGDRLVTELRADPSTRGAFIAALTSGESHRPNPGIDSVTLGDALHPEVVELLGLIARQAGRASLDGMKAA